MKKKWVLLNPGPVNVTDRVRKALLGPDICHREEEFSKLLLDTSARLLKIFGISKTHTVAFFSGSGTTALEAMLSAAIVDNQKVLVLSNGVYGERIHKILQIHGSKIALLETKIGEFPSIQKIEFLLKNDPLIHAIAMVHHETSSGMLNPLSEVSKIAKKYRKTFIVDAISSLGAEKIDFKNDSIDFLAGTSGKCLHGFPGVSFVIIAKNALPKILNKKPKSFALDLATALENCEKGDTAFTPAVQIFYAFNEALKELEAQGLNNRIASYAKKSLALEQGFKSLGISFVISPSYRSHVLTALWTPEKISYEALHDKLKKDGFIIYAGQSSLKGKIFRVSNLGELSLIDIQKFLKSLKKILSS